jgi:hypothetical protein
VKADCQAGGRQHRVQGCQVERVPFFPAALCVICWNCYGFIVVYDSNLGRRLLRILSAHGKNVPQIPQLLEEVEAAVRLWDT